MIFPVITERASPAHDRRPQRCPRDAGRVAEVTVGRGEPGLGQTLI